MIWRRDARGPSTRAGDLHRETEQNGSAVDDYRHGVVRADPSGDELPADAASLDAAPPDDVVTGKDLVSDDLDRAERDRRTLIDLVIYAYDRTTSTGVRARLADGLSQVGVRTVEPDGESFDATQHEAGGVEPTDDETLHDRIAETERAGFRDGDRVIREPTVVVYRRR